MSNEFNKFCKDNGIKRQLTAAYTPQQNRVAKSRNRTIMNMVRCLLSEKEMPKKLWTKAARWTAHVLNRSCTKTIKDMVLEEKWSGIKNQMWNTSEYLVQLYMFIFSNRREPNLMIKVSNASCLELVMNLRPIASMIQQQRR